MKKRGTPASKVKGTQKMPAQMATLARVCSVEIRASMASLATPSGRQPPISKGWDGSSGTASLGPASGRAFLKAADRIHSLTPQTQNAYRQEAETVARQIDRACSALDAQRHHPHAKKDKKAALTDLYQKLRLEQAKLYVLIWKLGGYEEDEHPDVVYRDQALDICENEELVDMKEAKALRATIYKHILDRWHWIEGRQIVQNHKQKRKDLQKKLESLIRELEKTQKL